MQITTSTGMKPLTGSRLIQNENVWKSDEFQTDANSSHLPPTYSALPGISYPRVS